MVAQLVWDQWVGGSNPLSPTTFKKGLTVRLALFAFCERKRMRTSEGGLTRAKRENVASATARRASRVAASHPLSPTTFKKGLTVRLALFAFCERKRMRTPEGGLTRAKRENVASATARRASREAASHPLSPTTFKKGLTARLALFAFCERKNITQM